MTLPTGSEARIVEVGWLVRADWLSALRQRTSGGPVLVDACGTCSRPLTAPPETALVVVCDACGAREEHPLHEHIDVLPRIRLPKPDWELEGGLLFEPYVLRGALSESIACPGCSAPVAPFVGEGTCSSCDASFLAYATPESRFLVGMHVTGAHNGTGVDGWMPLLDALAYLDGYRELGHASKWATASGFATWAVFALLFVVGGPTLLCVVGGLSSAFPGQAALWMLGGFGTFFAAFLLGGVTVFAVPFWVHRRARKRLGLESPPRLVRLVGTPDLRVPPVSAP